MFTFSFFAFATMWMQTFHPGMNRPNTIAQPPSKWLRFRKYGAHWGDAIGAQCDLCLRPRGHISQTWGSCKECDIDVCHECLGLTPEIRNPPLVYNQAVINLYYYLYENRTQPRFPEAGTCYRANGEATVGVIVSSYSGRLLLHISPNTPDSGLHDNEYAVEDGYNGITALKEYCEDDDRDVDLSFLETALDGMVLGEATAENWADYLDNEFPETGVEDLFASDEEDYVFSDEDA